MRYFRARSFRDILPDGALMRTASVCGLVAWGIHSMMEVSYETPASMALAIVFGMIVCSGREENTADGTEEGRHPRLWKTMRRMKC